MKHTTLVRRLQVSVVVCGMVLAYPFSLAAQEAAQKQHEEQPGKRNAQERKGQGHPEIMTEIQQMRKERKKMRQEMTRALQQQMTALREHAKAMAEVNDERQLLVEMKKHLQMTDAILGTMVEQRATRDAVVKERREEIWGHMRKPPQTEKNEPEGYETPHEGK